MSSFHTRFEKGDEVFGVAVPAHSAHAEYTCLPEDGALALKPANTTHHEAVADGAMTALPFPRNEANLQGGQTILINGASGGAGTAAMQLARYYGAHVTGVCSTENVDLVKALGADTVMSTRKRISPKAARPTMSSSTRWGSAPIPVAGLR